MSPSTTIIRLILPATSRAPSMARRAMQRGLPRDRIAGPHRSDASILVNELVTNSVRHADLPDEGPISVAAELIAERLHVEVSDPGRGFVPPDPMPVDHDGGSGWGLRLVDGIADEWGVLREGEATTVWFDIDL